MPIYLHGFASGPGSTKAQFFKAQLDVHGIDLAIPDLAPDFTHLTITSQLAMAESLLADRAPDVLLGSSLGGYLAALVAARHPAWVRGLVLMAPAVNFAARWEQRVGAEGMARWRANGTTMVQHYGRRREEPLAIDLIEDAHRHPAVPDPLVPALVLAGRHDDAVPLEDVRAFAAARPSRTLVVYDAGHELTEVLAPMWERTWAFLQTLSPRAAGT